MSMCNLISKLAACQQQQRELVECHKTCLPDLQSLYKPCDGALSVAILAHRLVQKMANPVSTSNKNIGNVWNTRTITSPILHTTFTRGKQSWEKTLAGHRIGHGSGEFRYSNVAPEPGPICYTMMISSTEFGFIRYAVCLQIVDQPEIRYWQEFSGAQPKVDLGWGLLSQFPPFRYFLKFSPLSKHTLATEYHVYIWQVSPQLSCGGTCQI